MQQVKAFKKSQQMQAGINNSSAVNHISSTASGSTNMRLSNIRSLHQEVGRKHMLQSATAQHHNMITPANTSNGYGSSHTNYGGLAHTSQINSITFKRQLAQSKGYGVGINANGRTQLLRPKHVLACSSSSESDSESSILSQQETTTGFVGPDSGSILAAETATILVMQQSVGEDDSSIKGGGATVAAAENDDNDQQEEAFADAATGAAADTVIAGINTIAESANRCNLQQRKAIEDNSFDHVEKEGHSSSE